MKKIPKKFWIYFWDVDPRKIDLQKNDKYVVERVLEWGGFASLKWLLKTYGLKKIIFTFKNARGLSRRTVNFYRYLFNLKKEELRCFQRPFFPKLSWYFGR